MEYEANCRQQKQMLAEIGKLSIKKILSWMFWEKVSFDRHSYVLTEISITQT